MPGTCFFRNRFRHIGLGAINDNDQAFNVAQFDIISLDVTDTTEDGALAFGVMSAGTVREVLRLTGDGAGTTTGDIVRITSTTAETNGIVDILELRLDSTGTTDDLFGAGIAIQLDDAGGVEEQGSIDFQLSTAADGSEDLDIIVRQNTNGDVRETLRLVANLSATTADRLQWTANTSETNGIVEVARFVLDTTGTGTANIGAGISIHIDDAGGVEEQAKVEFQLTTAADTTEDCDIIFSQNINGTITETVRIDADGGLALSSLGLVPAQETVTTGSPTLATYGSTNIDSSGGAVTGTLGSPDLTTAAVGQLKTIVMTDATTSSTISITNHETSDPEVATFDAVDEYWLGVWTGTEWATVSATCTFV